MKYKELIQFEPINEVVKFSRLEEEDYRKSLVRNFVFSKDYEKTIIPRICENLDYTQTYRPFQKDLFSGFDTFGLQIVGNYGTGKSHLMSLVSLIAENKDYLPLISNESAKEALGAIAGKYKIIRFELGNDQELWDIICYQIVCFTGVPDRNHSSLSMVLPRQSTRCYSSIYSPHTRDPACRDFSAASAPCRISFL